MGTPILELGKRRAIRPVFGAVGLEIRETGFHLHTHLASRHRPRFGGGTDHFDCAVEAAVDDRQFTKDESEPVPLWRGVDNLVDQPNPFAGNTLVADLGQVCHRGESYAVG